MNKIISIVILLLFVSCYVKKEQSIMNTVYTAKDLLEAIDRDDEDVINRIISGKFDINETVDERQNSFLDYAIAKNKETSAIVLMSHGADVNHIDSKS